jgi:D-alanyl-lipoteichoic acid acyltransferase DltB (MBOAT superfamily)
MCLGGLWHGANWIFLIWGMIHGLGLALERWRQSGRAAVAAGESNGRFHSNWLKLWAKRILLFQFVCFGWIFFRAQSLTGALHMLAGVTSFVWSPDYMTAFEFLILFSAPLLLLDLRMEKFSEEYPFQKIDGRSAKANYAWRTAVAGLLMITVLLLAATKTSAFIYFQF